MNDADLRLRIEMIPHQGGAQRANKMGPTQWRKLTALLEKKHLGCVKIWRGSLQGLFHAWARSGLAKEGRSRALRR